jgi:hypothetical protein
MQLNHDARVVAQIISDLSGVPEENFKLVSPKRESND